MPRKHRNRVELVAEEIAELSNEELERLGLIISKRNPQLIRRLESAVGAPSKKHSIMELEGLGADIWQSIDVDEYLRRERDSWR